MFAVVNHLAFTQPVDSFQDILETDGMPILSAHEGFINFYFIKVDEFNAIVFILWKDADSGMAGAKSFGPTWFAHHIKPYLKGPEERYTGEVKVTSDINVSKDYR